MKHNKRYHDAKKEQRNNEFQNRRKHLKIETTVKLVYFFISCLVQTVTFFQLIMYILCTHNSLFFFSIVTKESSRRAFAGFLTFLQSIIPRMVLV